MPNYGKIRDFPRNSLGPKRASCQKCQIMTKFVISRAIRLAGSLRAPKMPKECQIWELPGNSLGPKRAGFQKLQIMAKFVISRAIRLARSVRAAKMPNLLQNL